MKQSRTGFILFVGLIIATLFVSCNSGNKVVASFGKRKYTKGYFFNSYTASKTVPKAGIGLPERNAGHISHDDSSNGISVQKQSVPASNKVDRYPIEVVGKKSFVKSLSINSILPQLLTAKDIFKNNSPAIKMPADTAQADNAPTDYRKYNREAIGGLLLGIACGCLIGTGFGLLLAIPGFFLSLWGLDSQKFHTLAVIGVILNLIGLVALIVFLLVELIVIANGGGGA